MIAERIELVVAMKENGWSGQEVADETGIPRTTLQGFWLEEEALYSTTVDPWSKRATRPGLPPPTEEIEPALVQLIKHRAIEGNPMSRGDIIAGCHHNFPEFAQKTIGALNSWVARFIKSATTYVTSSRFTPKPPKTTRTSTEESLYEYVDYRKSQKKIGYGFLSSKTRMDSE